jgi:hypothetical protein
VVRLDFYSSSVNGPSSWTIAPIVSHFLRFRKSDYVGIDSAVVYFCFMTSPGTGCDAQLYDVTNDSEISGSTATVPGDPGMDHTTAWRSSGDFWENVPDSEFTLAFRVRSRIPATGGSGVVVRATILLFRR